MRQNNRLWINGLYWWFCLSPKILKKWHVVLLDSSEFSSFIVTRNASYFDKKRIWGMYDLKSAEALRKRYKEYGEKTTIFKITVWPQVKDSVKDAVHIRRLFK